MDAATVDGDNKLTVNRNAEDATAVASSSCELEFPRFCSISNRTSQPTVQRSKKWLVRGLVKFATAVARLVCPDLLG